VSSNLEELLGRIADEEARLQLDRFTNDDAIDLGLAIVEVARAQDAPVTVDVRRFHQQVFHAALEGTSADNDRWIERKVRVVQHFGHSSFYMGVLLRSQDLTMEQAYLLDGREYAAHGGAFPITVRGVGIVGTVTVSGLPQADDHQLVVETLERFVAGRSPLT
jgi:uncharacterized protein (UPF0303 family)